jgi:hypothetical protein
LRFQIVFGKLLQQGIGKQVRLAFGVELLFVQVIAVIAPHVAQSAGRLKHYIQRPGKRADAGFYFHLWIIFRGKVI